MHRISLPSVAVWQMFYVQITVKKTRFLRGYVQSVGFRKTTLEYTAAERAGGASHYTLKKLMNFAISTIVGFSDLFSVKRSNGTPPHEEYVSVGNWSPVLCGHSQQTSYG